MIPQWQQDIINSQIKKHIFKIEWLNPEEEVIDEVLVDVVDGSANFDGTKNNQRGVSLTLKNLEGQYTPYSNSKMWINNKFRLSAGYEYNSGENLFFNQGIYCLGNPSLLSSPARKEITIQGLDKWTLLDGTLAGKLKNKIIINIGTRIDVAIKSILDNIIEEDKYIIEECDFELPYTFETEIGTPVSESLIELGNIVAYESFYNNEGFFVFRKYLDPQEYEQTASSWDYTTEGLYLESKRDLLWNDIRNSILVLGDTLPNGITVSAIAQDTSDSDMSIGAIGERFEFIEDSLIQDDYWVQERANWELKQRIMLAETCNADIIPNFSHKVSDIVSVLDNNSGLTGNYVIQSINYNFKFDTAMGLTLWKVRDWR